MPEASRETNGQATTVLLANGHRLFRLGLKEIRSADGSIKVLGEAENDEEVVALTEETKPDVVVLDTDDEPVTGMREVISRILKIPPPPGVILIATQHSSSRPPWELLARAVSAYLDKDASPEDLIAAVWTAAHGPRGKNAFAAVPRAALAQAGQEARDGLSRRELEVLLLAVRGLSNRQIACALSLSEATVKRHLANLYPKMGVCSRLGATRKALSEGWISVRDIVGPGNGAAEEARAETSGMPRSRG